MHQNFTPLQFSKNNQYQYDIVVAGSGAGGLSAAVFAALKGKRVLLVESTEYVGGTTALSGGTTWAPLTRLGKALNPNDSYDNCLEFLNAAVGQASPQHMREAFLKNSSAAIHRLMDNTQVDFRACAFHPDYLSNLPHSTVNGRALEPLPYVTRRLGTAIKLLRPPIPEFTVLNGMMINREDINNLLDRYKSIKSFIYTAKLVSNFMWDKLRFGQSARSVMGHALIARLFASAINLKIDIALNTEIEVIKISGKKISGIRLVQNNGRILVNINSGLILAGGGFGRNSQQRSAHYPSTVSAYSPAASGHKGNLQKLAIQLGAYLGKGEKQPAFWAPSSIRKRKDGTIAVFPHFVFDRSKPGTICVDTTGNRFVNESVSYHDFGAAMLAGGEATKTSFLIADSKAIAKYGLGMVRLGGDNLRPYLADSYLVKGDSIEKLAEKIGVDAVNLTASIEQINEAATTGVDEKFSRGTTIYQTNNGDAEHKPNPTIGTLSKAPFYAVKLYPADIGTSKGLVSNENANLIRKDGTPIIGLYACGNDLNSIMGGVYPGPGITIGPAITFAYIAVNHLMQVK